MSGYWVALSIPSEIIWRKNEIDVVFPICEKGKVNGTASLNLSAESISELVAGSEQVRHAMADGAANPPSPSNTTLPAIDSDEVMRIVALDQQHQTPQPLISLEPTPEQTFLLVSPQVQTHK